MVGALDVLSEGAVDAQRLAAVPIQQDHRRRVVIRQPPALGFRIVGVLEVGDNDVLCADRRAQERAGRDDDEQCPHVDTLASLGMQAVGAPSEGRTPCVRPERTTGGAECSPRWGVPVFGPVCPHGFLKAFFPFALRSPRRGVPSAWRPRVARSMALLSMSLSAGSPCVPRPSSARTVMLLSSI